MAFVEAQMERAIRETHADKLCLLSAPAERKLNIGSGGVCDPLWTNLDRSYGPAELGVGADGCLRVKGDFTRLADMYKPESFALGYSHHTLEHVPYKEAAATLRQWWDLIEPGGVLYVCVPDTLWCISAVNGGPLWLALPAYRRGKVDLSRITWEEVHSFILSGCGHLSTWWQQALIAKLTDAGFYPVTVWERKELADRADVMAHCETAVVAIKPRSRR